MGGHGEGGLEVRLVLGRDGQGRGSISVTDLYRRDFGKTVLHFSTLVVTAVTGS